MCIRDSSNTPDYYKQVTDAVKEFLSSRQYDNDKVLGISIATQGITSPDHTTVLYGDIMNNAGMKLDDFSRYLPYPCYLEHDSKSAAFLELWNHPELDSAVIILLNRNLGGGIITNHQIHQGISMPVSYTHLDVYKRQVLFCDFTAFIHCCCKIISDIQNCLTVCHKATVFKMMIQTSEMCIRDRPLRFPDVENFICLS